MKKIVLLAALALASPAWAQAPVEKKAEAVKPAPKAKAVKAAKKASARRHQDARHCLQRPNNDAIIRCAEEYL